MKITCALCWAAAMLSLALLGRFGSADRDAVITMLLVMPVIAFVTLRGGPGCAMSPRAAK